MKYIYIGTAASDFELNNLFAKYARRSIVYVQQKWDYIFCKALQDILKDDFFVISYQPVQTFPAGKGIVLHQTMISGLNGIYIKSSNLPVIKQWTSKKAVKREILRIAKEFPDEEIRVITHTTYYQSLRATNEAKRECNRIKLFSMVPDLPDYSTGEKVETGSITRKLFGKYKEMSIKEKMNVDGYICFSEPQMEKLNRDKVHTVMEGFVSQQMLEDTDKVDAAAEKFFLYAGNLKEDSGVLMLSQAFSQASISGAKLYICGEGAQRNAIEQLDCPDIKLLGVLPREEILKLEKQAYALVNPRPIGEEFSKYSFPSKLLEYMASGTPVLTTHLPCIQPEYDQFLTYVEEDTVEAFIAGLKKCEEGSFRAKGALAKSFVSENKNVKKQAQKVIDFVTNTN